MTRPAKKSSTVDELRGMLGDIGLETKGKRETLWKRLLGHFKRSPIPAPLITADPGQSSSEAVKAQTKEKEPITSEAEAEAKSEKDGLSAKKWGKQPIRAFLCFDVEATCRGGKEFDWPNEIIEFPVVLLRWAEDVEDPSTQETEVDQSKAGPSTSTKKGPRLVKVDEFHSYVRPVWSPQLSEFCTRFTGITQEMVDASPTFPFVLKKLEAWLDFHGLRLIDDGEAVEGLVNACWVTDGPWDLRDFIPKQLHITPCTPASPLYLRQPYLNLKQAFQTVLSEQYRREQYARSHPNQAPNERSLSRITTGKLVGRQSQEKIKGLGFYLTIPGMLAKLGLGEFEGRQHCGLDDANNVARILQALVERDILVETNARLPPPKNAKKWAWMGKPGEVHWEEWMSDAKRPMAGAAAATPAEPSPATGSADSADTKGEVKELEGKERSTAGEQPGAVGAGGKDGPASPIVVDAGEEESAAKDKSEPVIEAQIMAGEGKSKGNIASQVQLGPVVGETQASKPAVKA